MRINKFISETGFCSRRAADRLIEEGRVTINNVLATLGSQAEEVDIVMIDGRPIGRKKEGIYIVLNKPEGITCTTDRSIEGNIIDYINHKERIFHIGRLDKDSEGLILLTNDGDIVNQILREENNHDKEYVVTVTKNVTDDFLEGMSQGVHILGIKTKPCQIQKLNERMFKITLTQGLNRQIRRMCQAFDYEVEKLRRIRIMNIEIGSLGLGEWRYLTESEINSLLEQLHQ